MSWRGFRLFRRGRNEAPEPAVPATAESESDEAREAGGEEAPAQDASSFAERCDAVLAASTTVLLERVGDGLAELGLFLDVDVGAGDDLGALLEDASRHGEVAGTHEERGPEPEPAEPPEPIGPPVNERDVELERLRRALEDSQAKVDALDQELGGLQEARAALAAECEVLRETEAQHLGELASRREEVEAERRRAKTAQAEREALAKDLDTARLDLETTRADLETATAESARLIESDARLREVIADWVVRLFRAGDDGHAAPETEGLDELVDLGRGKLDQLAAELRWRRVEMAEVGAAFEQRMWRMVGGPVRRMRTWCDADARAASERNGPGGAP